MDVEIFHLWQLVNQPYAGVVIIAVVALIAVGGVVGYLIYRRWLSPLVLWPFLFLFFFGFSQVFPENRSQCKEIAAVMVIPSGVLAWLAWRFIRDFREKHEKFERLN